MNWIEMSNGFTFKVEYDRPFFLSLSIQHESVSHEVYYLEQYNSRDMFSYLWIRNLKVVNFYILQNWYARDDS